jgi:hypothetical protein
LKEKKENDKTERTEEGYGSTIRISSEHAMGGLFALFQVEVSAEPGVGFAGVNTLDPTVEPLVKIVQVVLAQTAFARQGSGGIVVGHILEPSVIFAKSEKKVTIAGGDRVSEELGSGPSIEIHFLACFGRSSFALFVGELEQTNLSTSTNDLGVAGGLLHGKGSQEDRRDLVHFGVLPDDGHDISAALGERAFVFKRDIDYV